MVKKAVTGKQKQSCLKANAVFFRYYHAYAACKVWILWVVPFFQKQGIIKKKNRISPKTWYHCDITKFAWMER